ncbi:hypothetical protein ASPACDRAFT_125098 [Aspergillus aculeatus ATCC 16872]|uniref:Uncharacterized protein n=1 Tax=Aspergillus aculeatus (strain ATCC 16872 / CBS 172.66 / WB 5094) TaxID=690307 RepID=A0A1L9WK03_ASPA1|nr:uncharacterized protein ASPACDRAFT_125098 [Aspergillus aculeatus ATCC 16872]OJJ96484.1 hypothetical protein ASPACDRAFT_125098 [Aspergillus aculeatus ATCC 16872]
MPDKKKSKKSSSGGGAGGDAPVITDPRFANIQNDPRYRLPSKRHTHVKLDKRFAHMLRDKDFSRNAAVDRYGRKLARDDTKKQLERFYRLEDDEDDASEGEEVEGSVADDEEVLAELRRAEKYDPARDGGFESSSSEEESSDDEDDTEDEGEGEGDGEQLGGEELEFPDKQQRDVPTGEVTDRIAVVNLDWDNIRAEDLMAVFSSFVPAGGRVLKVSVYPRGDGDDDGEDFEGFDDDEEEELDSDEEEEKIKKSMLKEDKGEEFNSTKLRKYQLERLRYFYAILTFSSKEVAKHVYDLVDGAEYLSSANFFDLRFVPDETDFDDDRPRDECKRIPDGYQPNEFVTDALQHSKVKLTWDMEDKSRKEAQARAFRGSRKDIDENDLKAYLASDSSDDEEEDGGVEVMDATQGEGSSTNISKKEEERQRMRALLGLSAEPTKSSKSDGPVGEMEVTFTSGLAGEPTRDSIFENEPQIEETTIERYIRKERERKKRRKEKLKATKQGGDGDASDVEQNDAKPTAEEQPPQEDLGFDDPFFEDPDGKATAAARRKEEKRKKREERAAAEAAAAAKRAELELLMVDDNNNKGIKHFDMTEIEKAEKQARKKGKKGKGKAKQVEPVVDDFKMEVNDPRFSRLFESHEFAIDPTNPKFKPTSGMKALLEEGRKRRRDRDDHAEEAPSNQDRTKKQKKQASKDAGSDDLKKLVDKVKRKTQR